ncbi:MAG: FadR family transcriptional regulator [Devosiaceae bacterium]|nr:FadR family transcriptional regulator [Devosiaceae bacterium MH13]
MARNSLVEEIEGQLADSIVAGALTPGSRLLPAGEIAQTNGVSISVVREALSRLQARGLVRVKHGVGAFVEADVTGFSFALRSSDVGSREVIDILELRAGIEAEAAGLAAIRATDAHIADLEAQLQEMTRSGSRRGASFGGLQDDAPAQEADFRFHRTLIEAADNPHFTSFFLFLEPVIRNAVHQTRTWSAAREGFSAEAQKEHEAIFEAVRRGDPVEARKVARLHQTNAIDRLRVRDGAGETVREIA